MPRALFLVLALAPIAAATEPPPRPLKAAPLKIATPLTHVSAARELPDGRVVITNGKQPSVLLLDPGTGLTTPLGAPGGGPDRYAKPGGLYAGPAGATLLLDRGQARIFTISPGGALEGSRSIAQRGVTSSSDVDRDLQQVDAGGLVYFVDRHRTADEAPTESTLVRFDPAAQTSAVVARLRLPEARVVSGGDGMVFRRSFIGSPADGWGVAPDGRVVVVRARPYRVEWHAPDGGVTRGPEIAYTPLPMTEADRKHYAAAAGPVVSVGLTGAARTDAAAMGLLFAETRAPFHPDDISVSPEGRVWVMRAQPFGLRAVVYDGFDSAGRRADRIELPAGSRIVGFGPGSIYVRHIDEAARCELRKYRVN
jgi:sugar lactone lactonase YvrE